MKDFEVLCTGSEMWNLASLHQGITQAQKFWICGHFIITGESHSGLSRRFLDLEYSTVSRPNYVNKMIVEFYHFLKANGRFWGVVYR